jgi:nucleoside-diphosphate-sugar epimerase
MNLVTGGSGFLGSHLVRFLSAQGLPVRALYHQNRPPEQLLGLSGVAWHRCDLLDVYAVEEAMQGVEQVYHCAAIVSFQAGRKAEMLHANVAITANLVNQALAQGIRKMAFVGSIASLGRGGAQQEITEAEEWQESKNNSAYSQSKYLAEMEVWRGIAEGMQGVIINPGIILGEAHNWQEGSARLMQLAARSFPFYTQGINGWVDVADVVQVLYRLMESTVAAERFIVVAGNYSYKDIFTRMAQALGTKPPHIKASPRMTAWVWRWNVLRHRLLGTPVAITRETARTAHQQCLYNNTKLLRFLPDFSYTPVGETISRMAIAYRQQNQDA